MTAPVEIVLDESLLDEDTPRLGHVECQDMGPDDPYHSICGAPLRGVPWRPGDGVCTTCTALVIGQNIATCPRHGSRVDPFWWTRRP